MPTDKHLTGLAGVHYVAFQLSSRGYAVALTGAKDVYLRATHAPTGKSLSIKVKTATRAYRKPGRWVTRWIWQLGEGLAERKGRKDFFVIFVDLHGGPPTEPDVPWSPDVFIVPSADLESLVNRFPAKGVARDFWSVIVEEDAYKYRNKWEKIGEALW